MQVATLTRYPVKSMLGQEVDSLAFGTSGPAGDRRLAFVDPATGYVATAKHPRRWRGLLQYTAGLDDGHVVVTTPGGDRVAVDDPRLVETLVADLGRAVELRGARTPGAEVERSDPEVLFVEGDDAEVETPTLEIAQGAPGATFVDHSPVHLITGATLEHLGMAACRYRPNIVVAGGGEPFGENGWVGREVAVGEVVLRVTLPTPRCAVPTQPHGDLPRDVEAVRPLLSANRVEVEGFGVLPCAGAYAEVVRGGTVSRGDVVTVG